MNSKDEAKQKLDGIILIVICVLFMLISIRYLDKDLTPCLILFPLGVGTLLDNPYKTSKDVKKRTIR